MNLEGLSASNFHQINDFSLTTAWFDPSVMGVTVPDGTLLYGIQVVRNNLADDCIEVSINGEVIPTQVVVSRSDQIMESTLEVNNGNICTGEAGSLFGNIFRETGQGVPDVTVTLTNNLSLIHI